MDWKRGFGIGLMLIGLFLTLTSKIITGAIIGKGGPENYLGLFGLLVFIIGAFLIVVSKIGGLEKELGEVEKSAVYDTAKGRLGKLVEEGKRYFMRDPNHVFTTEDYVNLEDVRELYEVVKEDKNLLERTREVYGKMLYDVVREEDRTNAEIAMMFLNVLYEGKIPEVYMHRVEMPYEEPHLAGLTKEEKREIKDAFRSGWKTDFNKTQREILRKYNFGYSKDGRGHLVVYSLENKNLKTRTSYTPSDWRVGINFANKLIDYIDESMRARSNVA